MDLKLQQKTYFMLEEKIKQAVIKKQPIEAFVKEQIKLLESVHDNFVSEAKKNNPDVINNFKFDEIRIKQLQAIMSLCEKIGLPTEKYSKQIHEIRVKRFGADFVKENFKS